MHELRRRVAEACGWKTVRESDGLWSIYLRDHLVSCNWEEEYDLYQYYPVVDNNLADGLVGDLSDVELAEYVNALHEQNTIPDSLDLAVQALITMKPEQKLKAWLKVKGK